MKNFSIPFGKEKITFSLPDEQVAGVLLSHAHEYKAPKSEAELVADAIGKSNWQPEIKRAGQRQKDVHDHIQRPYATRPEPCYHAAAAG